MFTKDPGWKKPSASGVGASTILGGTADRDALRKALQNIIKYDCRSKEDNDSFTICTSFTQSACQKNTAMTVYTSMNTIGEKEWLVTTARPDITNGLPDTGLPMR
jgi:hypothetical protein